MFIFPSPLYIYIYTSLSPSLRYWYVVLLLRATSTTSSESIGSRRYRWDLRSPLPVPHQPLLAVLVLPGGAVSPLPPLELRPLPRWSLSNRYIQSVCKTTVNCIGCWLPVRSRGNTEARYRYPGHRYSVEESRQRRLSMV